MKQNALFHTLVALTILSSFSACKKSSSTEPTSPEPDLKGRIVYWSGGNLFLLDLQARDLQPIQLTHQIEVLFPVVSVDGAWVAFQGIVPGRSSDIYVMRSDGSGLIDVTNTTGVSEIDPSWSPDGQRIVYDHASAPSSIWTISVDGSGSHVLVGDTTRSYGWPRWSPSRDEVIFQSIKRFSNDRVQIHRVNGDGTGEVTLTSGNRNVYYAEWSPDGNWILYCGDALGLYVMDQNGMNARQVWPLGGFKIAEFSPDSRRIACMAEGTGDLTIIDRDGTNAVQLTQNPPNVDANYPAWSLDGAYLAFACGNGDSSDIHVVDIQRKLIARVTDMGNASFPVWVR